jgi:hypothetical protein
MNRRTFASWSLLALGTAFFRAPTGRETGSDLTSQLNALFSAPSDAIALGRRYLALHPAMAARERLMRNLGVASDGSRLKAPLLEIVSRARDTDFRDGNMVVLDGWILARSEIAVCALLALA